nr:ABC transporter ATP-binding protein [Sandaracinobacteroides sayramensis]
MGVRLGGREVLGGLSTQLPAGLLVGVLGPNGAGKSSFLKALAGLLPHAGRVLLDGAPLAHMPRAEVARRIAYLPQGQTLHWPLAVERLVGLGRLPHLAPLSRIADSDRAAIERAMRRTDVAHLAQRTATELSGGERARVLLARALAVEAPVLLADEPLTSLDPAHQIEGMEILRDEARAGALVVAVMHDLALAYRYCDRILLLDRGRLVAEGPAGDVLTPGNLAEVYAISAFYGPPAERLLVPLDRLR